MFDVRADARVDDDVAEDVATEHVVAAHLEADLVRRDEGVPEASEHAGGFRRRRRADRILDERVVAEEGEPVFPRVRRDPLGRALHHRQQLLPRRRHRGHLERTQLGTSRAAAATYRPTAKLP